MKLVYSISILIYTSSVFIASFFNKKARLWVEGRRGWKRKLKEMGLFGEKLIWVHCASLGEFEQGRPLMEMIKLKFPEYRILLTFFSPSGYEIRKNWPLADHIFYLPSDTPGNAARFVELVNPEKVFFVKYEFWNNYISELYTRQIPIYLVSGIFRESQHFFKWYGFFFRDMLKKFTHIFVQNEESGKLLNSISVTRVSVAGDTRFDRVKMIASDAKELEFIERFRGGERILIAGSSWYQDEEIVCRYINTSPDRMKYIFAPHEISETNLARLESMLKVKSVRYSDADKGFKDVRVLIIDNIGILSSAYRYASIAVVGGGFGKGIHNILEAACWGLPVLFGPNHTKFREALQMIERGAAFCFRDYYEFSETVNNLQSDPNMFRLASEAALEYIEGNTGATEMILSMALTDDINNL